MEDSTLLSLLLIMVLAALVPLASAAFRRVRLPVVVGEIVVGIIIGHSGFNLVRESATLTFLSQFGFAFLMFLSGLEVDFGALRSRQRASEGRLAAFLSPLVLGSVTFLLTLGLAMGLSFQLIDVGLAKSPILMGLILSTTSLGIVVPVLKERRLISSSYGQTLLVAGLVADFATLLLISFLVAIERSGFTFDLLLALLLIGAFFTALRIGQAAQRIEFLKRAIAELSAATSQIRVRGAFALVVVWVVLAEAVGVEIILGAFLAGALLSLLSGSDESDLRQKLDAIGFGFLIPIFFIMVGIRFDLGALFGSTSALLLIPILLGAAYAVKLIPALLFRLRFSWRETFAAGMLLSSRLSLIIAAAAVAVDLGLISGATNSAIIVVAIVTCTVSPIAFMRVAPVLSDKVRKGIIIVGTSELGLILANRLRADGLDVVVVARDAQRVALAQRDGVRALAVDDIDEEALSQAGAETAEGLVSASIAFEVNLSAVRMATERFQIPTVVAWANTREEIAELQRLGARVIQPGVATALALEGALRFPSIFDLMSDKEDGAELGEAHLSSESLHGKSLRDLPLPGNALVIGIRRQGEVIVPHGQTTLRLHDVLMLVGTREGVQEAQDWLQHQHDLS